MSASPERHVILDPATARPAPFNGLGSELARWLSVAYLKLTGWTMHGVWPGFDKAVLVAAPHTSNWDGLNMLAAAGYYRIKLKWMGKKSLTTGPFGWVIKALGCVPIDRSASHDVVKTMAEVFARVHKMVLAVPPEGTRSAVRELLACMKRAKQYDCSTYTWSFRKEWMKRFGDALKALPGNPLPFAFNKSLSGAPLSLPSLLMVAKAFPRRVIVLLAGITACIGMLAGGLALAFGF